MLPASANHSGNPCHSLKSDTLSHTNGARFARDCQHRQTYSVDTTEFQPRAAALRSIGLVPKRLQHRSAGLRPRTGKAHSSFGTVPRSMIAEAAEIPRRPHRHFGSRLPRCEGYHRTCNYPSHSGRGIIWLFRHAAGETQTSQQGVSWRRFASPLPPCRAASGTAFGNLCRSAGLWFPLARALHLPHRRAR